MNLSLSSILNEQDLKLIPTNIQATIDCVLESKCKSLDFEKQRSLLLEKNYNDLKTKVEYQTELVNRYKGHISEIEADLHKSRRDLCDSNHEKDCLNVELKNLHLELSSKEDQLVKLEELIKNKNEESVKMIETNHKLQMEIEQMKIDSLNSDSNELQIKNLLNQKESLFNLERNHYKEELNRITNDFHDKCSKLNSSTSEFTIYKNEAETQISDLKKECNSLKSQNTFLNNLIEKKDNQINELAIKLKEVHQHQNMLKEQFESQEKEHVDLINCYKKSLDESKAVKNELVEKIKELHASFIESNESCRAAVEKYNNQNARFAEELQSKEDANMELRHKIEELELQLMNMSKKELDNSMKQFYPTSNTLSKIFEKNMPLSTVYTKYEELQVKFEELVNENNELRIRLQELIAESENNAPLIFYKTQENKKAFAEIEEYKTQLTKVSNDLENALSEIDNYNKMNNYLKRELKRYEKSNVDLSRQVQCLIQTVHEIKGNFVPTKFLVNDQFLDRESSFDRAISLNLVTFKNIEEVHENNQKLLSSIRELSEQYHELQDKFKNRNDDEESRKHIDKLLVEIENLKEENRHKQEILSEMMNERESKLNQSGKHDSNMSKEKQVSGSSLFKITSRAYLEEKIAELTNSLEKKNSEFENLKNQANMQEDQLRAEIKNYMEEISFKQNEISKLSVKLESLEENYKMLDSKLAQYSIEKGALKERNIKLEEQRKILKDRIGTFEAKKNELIAKLNEMKKELDAKERSIDLIEKENDHLKIESGIIKRRLEELTKELKENREELNKTKNEIQIGSIKNEYELKNQIQLLEVKNTNLQNTLSTLINEKNELNTKLVEAKSQSRTNTQQMKQQLIDLTTKNHAAIQEKNHILSLYKECLEKLKEIEQSTDDSANKTKIMKTHLELRNQLEEKNKEIAKLFKDRQELIDKLKHKETVLRQANQVNKQQIERFEEEVKNRLAQVTKQLEESSLREKVLKNRFETRLKMQDKELTELRQFKQNVAASNEAESQQQQQQSTSSKQEQLTPTVASHKPNTATIKPITVQSRLQQATVTTIPQAAVTPTQTISSINSPQTAYVVPTSVEQSNLENTTPTVPPSQSSTSFQNPPTSLLSNIQQNIPLNQPQQAQQSYQQTLSEQQQLTSTANTSLENSNLKRPRLINFEGFNSKKQKLTLFDHVKNSREQIEQATTSSTVVGDQETMQGIEQKESQQQPQHEKSTTVLPIDTRAEIDNNQTQIEDKPQQSASSSEETLVEMQSVPVSTEIHEEAADSINEKIEEQQTNEEMNVDQNEGPNEFTETNRDMQNNPEDESADEEEEKMFEEDEEGSDESGEDDEEVSEYDEADDVQNMQSNSQSNTQDRDQSSDIICLSGDEEQAGDDHTRDSKIDNDEESNYEQDDPQEEGNQAAASLKLMMNADFYQTDYQETEPEQQIAFEQEDSTDQQPKEETFQTEPSMPLLTALGKEVAYYPGKDQNIDYDNLIIDEQQQAADEQMSNDEPMQDMDTLTNFELSNPIASAEQSLFNTSKSIFSASNQEASTSFLQSQTTITDQTESISTEKTSQSKKPTKLKRPVILTKTTQQQQKDKPAE